MEGVGAFLRDTRHCPCVPDRARQRAGAGCPALGEKLGTDWIRNSRGNMKPYFSPLHPRKKILAGLGCPGMKDVFQGCCH